MALALFGTVGSFDANNDDWTLYEEQLEHYFLANEITDHERESNFFECVWSVNLPHAEESSDAGEACREDL